MEAEALNEPELTTFAVEVLNASVDPGEPVVLRVQAACTPRLDLRGLSVEIRDGEDKVVATGILEEFDGDVSRIDRLAITAPESPGACAWRAVLPIDEEDPPATPVAFEVRGHRSRPVVWDVPSAVEAGRPFRIRIGATSSAGLALAGRPASVHGADGALLAELVLGEEPWQGTAALHHAEVELVAPESVGRHVWTLRVPAFDADPPHGEGRATFTVNAVPRPEGVVRAEAVDARTGAPIPGAHLTMHPYRAVADAAGRAELHAPRGTYRVFAKARGFETARADIVLEDAVTVRLALASDAQDEHAWWAGA